MWNYLDIQALRFFYITIIFFACVQITEFIFYSLKFEEKVRRKFLIILIFKNNLIISECLDNINKTIIWLVQLSVRINAKHFVLFKQNIRINIINLK